MKLIGWYFNGIRYSFILHFSYNYVFYKQLEQIELQFKIAVSMNYIIILIIQLWCKNYELHVRNWLLIKFLNRNKMPTLQLNLLILIILNKK